jgi:isopentenyl-diphosphate Delta-isomerase
VTQQPGQHEQVVLLDEQGRATGVADKASVHHADTPLHLAFSCYIFDRAGRFLLTQRARHKPTWGGVWTNSCCGHPGPGEDLADAVRRRVEQELGLALPDLRLVLPGFGYRAVVPDGPHAGTVENEMCPVYVAVTGVDPTPDATEVAAYEWVDWAQFRSQVLAGERAISPWCAEQVAALPAEPWVAAPADPALLPEAARPVGSDRPAE